MTENSSSHTKGEIYSKIRTRLGDEAETLAKEFVSAFGNSAFQRTKEVHSFLSPVYVVSIYLADAIQREDNPLKYDTDTKAFIYNDRKGDRHFLGGLSDTTLDKDPLIEYMLQLVEISHNSLNPNVFSRERINIAVSVPEHRIRRDMSIIISTVGKVLEARNSLLTQ